VEGTEAEAAIARDREAVVFIRSSTIKPTTSSNSPSDSFLSSSTNRPSSLPCLTLATNSLALNVAVIAMDLCNVRAGVMSQQFQ